MRQAMASYLSLCGNEIVNAARLKGYVDSGIVPDGFNILCSGCDGLEDILPCVNSDAPDCGYQLPELPLHVDGEDNERFWAPWYDPDVPESKDFAGLLVTSVTMSAPYSREVTNNIGDGGVLGRLRRLPRTIVVHGFLIGKTCCATQYGLDWLTSALAGDLCDGCGGCDLDFLACCPGHGGQDSCITRTNPVTCEDELYVRPDEESEYQRAKDFWRRMHDVGVVSGPEVISCKGNSCGCGCGALIEVEFTLAAANPYIYSMEEEILEANAGDIDCNVCDVTWVKIPPGTSVCPTFDDCPELPGCLDDPLCPPPAAPPLPSPIKEPECDCPSYSTKRVVSNVTSTKDWGDSTLNFEVYAGAKDLRNLEIRIWQNPLGKDCLVTGCEDAPTQPAEFALDCMPSPTATAWCDEDDNTSTQLTQNVAQSYALGLLSGNHGAVIGARAVIRMSTVFVDEPDVPNPPTVATTIGFGTADDFTSPVAAIVPNDGLVYEFNMSVPLSALDLTSDGVALKNGSRYARVEVDDQTGNPKIVDVNVHHFRLYITVMPVHCIPEFPDCAACATLVVKYVPARGVLRFNGETREVTVTCLGETVNALRNIGSIDGNGPFAWPDLGCSPICAAVDFDCFTTADDAKVIISQVHRDL